MLRRAPKPRSRMKTIWKYYIDNGKQFIPKGAKFLTMQIDGYGAPAAWYEVETDNEKEEIYIFTVGTGFNLDEIGIVDCTYLGSYMEPPFAWHVYSKTFEIGGSDKVERVFLNGLAREIRKHSHLV